MNKGKTIGYIRVSSVDQNTERQLDGLKLDKIFCDKASGRNTFRPKLEELLNYVREGDTVIIHSMDRLARNLDDLRRIVHNLTEKHITITFLKENLTFTIEHSPMANLILSVMGAIAEFERSLIRERQMEGIALAQKRGIYKGRKPCLNESQVIEIRRRVSKGARKADLAREFNVSRETIYKYLRHFSN